MSWTLSKVRYAGGAAILATAAVACSDFLEVEDPGRYTDEALNSPLALVAVANGVESDFFGGMANIAYRLGEMSDEYMHTGTWNPDDNVDKGLTPTLTNNGTGQFQGGFLGSRTEAQKAQERFTKVMGDSANRNVLMARVVAVEAWANLWLGMYNCESPVAPDGAIVPDIEMYKLAIPLMTKTATIAKAAGSLEYERLAISGRARANLLAGNLDAALADAQTIPDTYVFTAKYSNAGAAPSNTIVTLTYRGRLKAAGLDKLHWSKVDTIAGFMRDPWTLAHDKRLAFTHPPNERGADGSTQHYNQEKYTDPADDVPVTHGMEMRLIEAEVYMKKGNLTAAMERINYVRGKAGLAAVTATTAADVQEKLLWERFAQLYLEGHRMNDLHRFDQVRAVLGANRPRKFPLTTSEIQLNTNVNGSLEGRCLPVS
jgi:hypothetical protein